MNDVIPWIDTILLVSILFYQWNRNRTLNDRIDQQTRLTYALLESETQQQVPENGPAARR